jgi:hypothetical protein
VVGEDVVLEVFGGVSKGSTKVMPCLRNKEAFLAVEEVTIGVFEVGVGWVSMGEHVSKLSKEGLAFLIIPSVHRA